MPIQQPLHRHKVVEPFLEGLLPDRDETRDAMGREFGVSGRNPFALLAHIGLDCAGAVQFAEADALTDVLERRGVLTAVDDQEIGARLRALRSGASASWVASGERWSLAGAQAKLALRRGDDGSWYEASGSEPTTHIIKPGVIEFEMQALNEHVCLGTAARLGLPAADSSYVEFDGQPAIVVTRYDRQFTASGLMRVHQEDLCQASGVSPRDKYESSGGPSAVDVVNLLRRHGHPSEQARNVERFTTYLVYNYLIGAPDAHAKNFSVLLIGDSVRLAPLYDVASGLPYDTTRQSGLNSAAMAIDGESRFGHVEARHWITFAAQTRQDGEELLDTVRRIATALPDAMSDALNDPRIAKPATELRQRMFDKASHLCAVTVGEIERSARYRTLRHDRSNRPSTGGAARQQVKAERRPSASPRRPLGDTEASASGPVFALSGPDSFLSDPPYVKTDSETRWLVLRALARLKTSKPLERLPRAVKSLGGEMPSGLLERWRVGLTESGLTGALREVVTDDRHSRGPVFVVTQSVDTGLDRGPDAVLRVGVFLPDMRDATVRLLVEVWLPPRGLHPLDLAVATLGDAAAYACEDLPAWLTTIVQGTSPSAQVVDVYIQAVANDAAYGIGLVPVGELLDLAPLGPPGPTPAMGFAGAERLGRQGPREAVARILDGAVWDQGFLDAPEGLFGSYVTPAGQEGSD
jgi:serine/threonine-protein kinase HipA